jgi:hypothetical protein
LIAEFYLAIGATMSEPVCKTNPDGTKEWFLNGQRHRTDGPAWEWSNGHKEWWLNGQRHRTDGPAVEWSDGSKQWFLNGEQHRTDGPAWEWHNGQKEWWLNGNQYSFEEYLNQLVKLGYEETAVKLLWELHNV